MSCRLNSVATLLVDMCNTDDKIKWLISVPPCIQCRIQCQCKDRPTYEHELQNATILATRNCFTVNNDHIALETGHNHWRQHCNTKLSLLHTVHKLMDLWPAIIDDACIMITASCICKVTKQSSSVIKQ